MKESRCSASPYHILHIIKGRVLEHRRMTDWGHTNLVSSSMLHRSDQSFLTGQTGLNRGQLNLILRSKNIVSRRWKVRFSPCKLTLGRPLPTRL